MSVGKIEKSWAEPLLGLMGQEQLWRDSKETPVQTTESTIWCSFTSVYHEVGSVSCF